MVNTQLIENLRMEHHYSQEQIAKMLGYDSHAAYSRKIKGQRQFTVEDVVALCKIFQLELNELIVMN